MNNLLKTFILTFILSSCAHIAKVSPNERRVFELYAKASLYEICNRKPISSRCIQVNTHLNDLQPEIYFFNSPERKEVLVIFTLNDFYPDVILRYDKDGLLNVVSRGIWLADKQEYIEGFVEYGDMTYDDSYAE